MNGMVRFLVLCLFYLPVSFGWQVYDRDHNRYVNDQYKYSVGVPSPYEIADQEAGVHGFVVHLHPANVAEMSSFASYELPLEFSDLLTDYTNSYIKRTCPTEQQLSIEAPVRRRFHGLPSMCVRGVCAGTKGVPDFIFEALSVSRIVDGGHVVYQFILESAVNRAATDRKVFLRMLESVRFLGLN